MWADDFKIIATSIHQNHCYHIISKSLPRFHNGAKQFLIIYRLLVVI